MGSIRQHIRLVEALSDWSEKWVHFTDQPFLKLHPKPGHNDPVGIYFFPASFKPNSFWRSKPYRYEVILRPEARVLDVSQVTQAQLDHLIDETGVRAAYDAYIGQYPKDEIIQRFDMAWECMQRGRFESGLSAAAWNKRIRQAGWDAIFDDTGSVHTSEVQLLVLDPRAIEITGMVRQKPSAFRAVEKVLGDLKAICEPFGTIEIEPPRRQQRWGAQNITASLTVQRNEDNYARFTVSHEFGQTSHPRVVVGMTYSRPSLNYGSGATYEMGSGEYQFDGLKGVERDLGKVFTPADQAAS